MKFLVYFSLFLVSRIKIGVTPSKIGAQNWCHPTYFPIFLLTQIGATLPIYLFSNIL